MKLAAIAFATLALLAGAGADVRSYVKVCYAKADKDLATKNVAAFDKLLRANITPDFKSTEMGQTEDYNHMLSSIRDAFNSMKHLDVCKTVFEKVVADSKKATFTSKRIMDGVMNGPDGKPHVLKSSMTSTDVWVHVGNVWKLKSMTWSDAKMSIDGKSINTQEAPKPRKIK